MNPAQKANMNRTLKSIQRGEIDNEHFKVREIITMADADLSPFVALRGEHISTNKLFNNRIVNKNLLRTHQASVQFEKNY